MLVLSRGDVERLLDLDDLVEALARAFADLSAGAASMPPRSAVSVPERDGFLAVMPSYLPSAGALTTKLVSVFPRNGELGLPSHQAVVVAFDAVSGSPLALMDGEYITAVRTAAASALSTRLLARADASIVAVLGTGVQARAHARAVSRVRRVTELRIAGRSEERAARLANELADELPFPVRTCGSFREAAEGADVVCATTHSPDPVVHREWLAPGTHVLSVGFNPHGREVDEATIVDAAVFVESREAALAPFPAGANDLTWPIRDGAIRPDHIRAELGELVAGTRPGRTSAEELTLYKSVGVAVEDAAAAALVLAAARGEH